MEVLYPKELVPKKRYKIIDVTDLVSNNYYLVREIKDKSKIENDVPISQEIISSDTKHYLDLSVNLLGIYQVAHSEIEIQKELISKYTSPWSEFTKGLTPVRSEFSLNKGKGVIYFKLDEINNFPFEKETDNLSFKCFCKVKHSPNKSNFWHFELNWYDDKGLIERVKDKTPNDRFPNAIRHSFRNLHSERARKKINENELIAIPPRKVFRRSYFNYLYRFLKVKIQFKTKAN